MTARTFDFDPGVEEGDHSVFTARVRVQEGNEEGYDSDDTIGLVAIVLSCRVGPVKKS